MMQDVHLLLKMSRLWGIRSVMILPDFFIVMLAFILISGCSGREENSTIKRPQVSGVTISLLAPAAVDDVFEATGTVRSDSTSIVASRVMGTVLSLLVREGEKVRAGQLLLNIDDREAKERSNAAAMAVESAKQNRELAEKTWQRYHGLYEQKALSRQEMDRIEAQRKVAQAEYSRAKAMADEAHTNVGFSRIVAPMDGVVKEKKIDEGSMAVPGMPLLIIEGSGEMYVGLAADEGLLSKIRTGMPAVVNITALKREVSGSVREIVPSVDPRSRTFTVKVYVTDKDLSTGLYARVRIPLGQTKTILVPEQAIIAKGQLTGVYAVDKQGLVTYRLIRTGKRFMNGVEILSGLSYGDRIITAGVDKAIDGGILDAGAKK